MDLMLDPACELETWADALKVGKACDAANFFWLEDPYKDGRRVDIRSSEVARSLSTPRCCRRSMYSVWSITLILSRMAVRISCAPARTKMAGLPVP